MNSLSPDPRADEIALAIDELALLFMALRKASSKTIHGLWAEMFIIVESAKPVDMLKAWHQESSEHFDFSSGFQRIEVKCSANRTRNHYFSLEQVYPPNGEIQVKELKEDEKPVKSLSNTQIKKLLSTAKRHKTMWMSVRWSFMDIP